MLRLLTAALAGAAFSLPSLAEDGPTEPAYLYSATVTKVLEGDLVEMDVDLGFYLTINAQRIRLMGIDAPAASGDTKIAGDAATAHLRELVEGKSVIVQTIRGEDAADRTGSFGNWLGHIYLDGKDINRAMVESGNAVSVP